MTSMRQRGGEFWTLKKVLFCIVLLSVLLSVFVLFRQRQWRLAGQRTLLVVHDTVHEVRKPLSLLIIEPDDSSLTVVPLPPSQKITAPFSYGSYATDSYIGLTQLEELDWSFLRFTLALEYGVVIDDIIWSKTEKIETRQQAVDIAASTLVPGSYTTIAYWDRMTLVRLLLSTAGYQFSSIDLEPFLLESGELDTAAFDQNVSGWWLDIPLRQSAPSVVIHNGSGIPGYAQRLSRALRLIGYDVLNIETVPEQDTSEVVYSQQAYLQRKEVWSLARLGALFASFSLRQDEALARRWRSEVVIVLGTDQAATFRRR